MSAETAIMYAFVIIHPPSSPIRTLDSILRERKICSNNGYIDFFASYRNLYKAYRWKYEGGKMWGVGFTTAALKRWRETNPDVRRDCFEHGGLISCRVYANEFWFPDFDVKQNDYFLVVPNTDAMRQLCYGENICKSYYYWRCKGVNDVYCKDMSDDELYKYLTVGYRFAQKNNIPIDAINPVPSQALVEFEYDLLNLMPEEMHHIKNVGSGMISGELF